MPDKLARIAQALGASWASRGQVLIELVQARVSQINGCAFCVDMHARAGRREADRMRRHGRSWFTM
jgi:alkylhydroperoxidase family enzyme